MRGLLNLRRGVVFLIALAVGMVSSAAFTCPRADSCPGMAKEAKDVRHACCDGDGQGRPAPEKRNECPGDCCRPACDVPVEVDALPVPVTTADAVLPPAVAISAPWDPEPVPVSDTSPPDRLDIPIFLLGSALLI
jgi:hypothetical protein